MELAGRYEHRLQMQICAKKKKKKKKSELGQGNDLDGRWRALPLKKNLLQSTSYLLPLLASKPSFAEWYAKPLRAPTFICLPCCAILACSEVWTWD